MENKRAKMSQEIIDTIIDCHQVWLQRLYKYLSSDFDNNDLENINRKLKALFEKDINKINIENMPIIYFVQYNGVASALSEVNNFHKLMLEKKSLLKNWFENTILINLNKFNEVSLDNLNHNVAEIFENDEYEFYDIFSVIKSKGYTKLKLLQLFHKYNYKYNSSSYILLFNGKPIALIIQSGKYGGDVIIHKLDIVEYQNMLADIRLLILENLNSGKNVDLSYALLKLDSAYFVAKDSFNNGEINSFFDKTLMQIYQDN